MNNPSRREILKLVAAAAASGILLPGSLTAAISRPSRLTYGLFFGDEDLDRMRRLFESDPSFGTFRDDLLSFDVAAERKFMADEVRYNVSAR